MRVRAPYELPDDKREKLRRAARLEWLSIFLIATAIAVVGFTAGSSQAMKTAWIEDMLSLIPPIAFLVAARFRDRAPDERFPYGYRRAVQIAFLVAALALTLFGGYLLVESALALIRGEHPTIGMIEVFNRQLWLGWLMILALLYSAVPPVILGYLKLPLARETHEKVLRADADMNKADWMTAVAGIVGILGVGYGYWWADATAAALISFSVLKDGLTNLSRSVGDIMDERPSTVDDNAPEELPDKLRERIEQLDWVRVADIRLREEGDVFNGEIYVVPVDENDLLARVEQATKIANDFEWRIHDIVVTPVHSLASDST